jgi:hypothetical protein
MHLGEIITPRFMTLREKVQADLYIKFMNLCADEHANTEMIAGACINALINVVHRMHLNSGDAEARWDDLFGQGKELLKSRFIRRPGG